MMYYISCLREFFLDGNILELDGTYLKIINNKFFRILVCEAQICALTYKIITWDGSYRQETRCFINDRYVRYNIN